MIGEEEHDRALADSVGFELFEELADLLVHERDQVVVAGPDLADRRRVGVVRRQDDLPGIVPLLRFELGPVLLFELLVGAVDLALVRSHDIEDAEERLAHAAVTPVGGLARIVPDRRVFEVVVFLEVVRAVVACGPQQLRERLDLLRDRDIRAKVLGSRARSRRRL